MTTTARKATRSTTGKTPAQGAAKSPAAGKTARKATVKAAPAKAAGKTAAKAAKPSAPKVPEAAPAPVKHKLVRDSFTIPKSEYAVLEALKQRATQLKQPAKKSELLRAGIAVLQGLGDKAFLAALAGVPSLKTGRPKRDAA